MRENSRSWSLLLLASVSAAGYAYLASLGRLDVRAPELIGVWLSLSVVYLVSAFLILRARPNRRLLWGVWAGALVFRALLLPVTPALSEDLFRYRWQGQVQAAGGNPYLARPEEPRWSSLRDETYPWVNRKDLASVYGPALELTHLVGYRVFAVVTDDPFRQAYLFRLPYALLDLGVGLAVMGLLGALGLARERVLLYLWSPLPIIELWAQGHNDPLAVLPVVLAVWAAVRARWGWAFAALGFAVMVKFWPIVLFPFFLLRREEGVWRFRWKQGLAAVPVMALAAAPYASTLAHVTELLAGFIGGWRNNDSLFGLIWEWAGRDYARATALVQRFLLAALAALWASQLRLPRAVLWAPVVLLLFSANVFPWYLLWFLPFLAVHPHPSLLLWTALVALQYQTLTPYTILGEWRYVEGSEWLEYLPVFALMLWEAGRALVHRKAESGVRAVRG